MYGTDRVKLTVPFYSVRRWGEYLFRRVLDMYSSPTCVVFVLGSSNWGLRSCVLATLYASGGKYFVVGAERQGALFVTDCHND